MPGRRDFLKSAAGAALSFQAVPAKRREVLVGQRRLKAVDTMSHFVAPEELDIVKNTNLARNVNTNGPLVLGPARRRAATSHVNFSGSGKRKANKRSLAI